LGVAAAEGENKKVRQIRKDERFESLFLPFSPPVLTFLIF
jgi:hypothetical protein